MKYLLKVRILSAVYICISQDLKIVCPYLFYFEKQGAQMFNLQIPSLPLSRFLWPDQNLQPVINHASTIMKYLLKVRNVYCINQRK